MKLSYLNINTIKSPNQCFRWWLVHSYLYYMEGESLISDEEWDQLGEWLTNSWDGVTDAQKHLVDISSVRSTGYYIREYPKQVICTARLIQRWHVNCLTRKKLALRKRQDIA